MSVTTATLIDDPAVVSVVSPDDESEEEPQPASTNDKTTARTTMRVTRELLNILTSFPAHSAQNTLNLNCYLRRSRGYGTLDRQSFRIVHALGIDDAVAVIAIESRSRYVLPDRVTFAADTEGQLSTMRLPTDEGLATSH